MSGAVGSEEDLPQPAFATGFFDEYENLEKTVKQGVRAVMAKFQKLTPAELTTDKACTWNSWRRPGTRGSARFASPGPCCSSPAPAPADLYLSRHGAPSPLLPA